MKNLRYIPFSLIRRIGFYQIKKTIICTLLILFPLVSSAQEQGQEYVPEYVGIWLEDHGFKEFKIENNTLIIESKGIEITGAIYNVEEKIKDQQYLIETRMTVVYRDKVLIQEFVAASGPSPNEAFFSSLQNLCETTFHPIYRALINPDDEHTQVKKVRSNNLENTYYFSGLGTAGELLTQEDIDSITNLVIDEISGIDLGQKYNSAKLVVSHIAGEKPLLDLSINSQTKQELTSHFHNFKWPETEKFYLAKLFVIIEQNR